MFIKVFMFMCCIVLPAALQANQVQLCSCSQATACASEGAQQLDSCKQECATWLASYAEGKSAQPLTSCFATEGGVEGDRLTNCMAEQITNFCFNSDDAANSTKSMLSPPDYNQWMESMSNASAANGKSGGAFIRKARTAFVVFRNFQKCMNNCAKRHSSGCFQKADCAITLPSERATSLSIYNTCTFQDVHKDARNSCRCLIQKHKVHQLVGVCPLMSNTYLMRML